MIDGCVGQDRLKQGAEYLVCFLVLLPCLLSAPLGRVMTGASFVIYWILTGGIAVLAVGGKNLFPLSRRQKSWLIIWMLLFFIALLNRNGDLQNGVEKPILYWLAIILFTAGIQLRESFRSRTLLTAILILLCIQLAAGYYFLAMPDQLLSLIDFFGLDGAWKGKFVSQIQAGYFMGFSTHYSTSGMYMALGCVLTAGMVMTDRIRRHRIAVWKVLLFAAFFAALILTGKRAHILFGVCAIFAMFFVGCMSGNFRNRMKQLLVLFGIALATLLLLIRIPAFSSTLSRFLVTGSLDELSSSRISGLWLPAWNAFLEHPLFGIGWRQFKYQFPMLQGEYLVNNDCHNIYLQLLCENGIIGALPFFAVMLCIFLMTWRALCRAKNNNSDHYEFILFSFGYQTFFLLYGLTGNPLYDMHCLFPYVIACALAFRYGEPFIRFPIRNQRVQSGGTA